MTTEDINIFSLLLNIILISLVFIQLTIFRIRNKEGIRWGKRYYLLSKKYGKILKRLAKYEPDSVELKKTQQEYDDNEE